MGMADLPTYNPTTKTQRILSTPDRPSGPLLEKKDIGAESTQETNARPHNQQTVQSLNQSQTKYGQQYIPSTPDRPSGPLLEEKNTTTNWMVSKSTQGNQRLKRLSISDEGERETSSDRRFVISDETPSKKAPVFDRLGPKRVQYNSIALEGDHRVGSQLSNQQAWRRDVKASSNKNVSTQLLSNVQPIIIPPRVPYYDVVKGNRPMVSSKSTLKSTNDLVYNCRLICHLRVQ